MSRTTQAVISFSWFVHLKEGVRKSYRPVRYQIHVLGVTVPCLTSSFGENDCARTGSVTRRHPSDNRLA